MRLSILICSIVERAAKLQNLMLLLRKQVGPIENGVGQEVSEVEILTSVDNREKSIGCKRNELVAAAHGDYVAFIDDDDEISGDYVVSVLGAIRGDPDCCGIEGVITFGGGSGRIFTHSLDYDGWFEHGGVYYRTPNHLNPIRRELALLAKFPEINHGEDKSFSDLILPLLNTESYINHPIYFYKCASMMRSRPGRAKMVIGPSLNRTKQNQPKKAVRIIHQPIQVSTPQSIARRRNPFGR